MTTADELRTAILSKGNAEAVFLEHEAKRLIAALGVPVPRRIFVPAGQRPTADGLTYPVVAKVVSPGIASKTDVNGIRLGIANEAELVAAAGELEKIAGAKGVLIEEMAQPGIEVIIGGILDPQFGPLVMFGFGGIFVELYRDVAFALTPLDRENAIRMVSLTKGARVLQGYRGKPPVDHELLISLLLTVSQLMHTGLLEEVDLNPVILYQSGGVVVDAKVKLHPT